MQTHILNVSEIRKDFPILKTKVNNKQLIYLDNSATSLTPQQVTDAITKYYNEYNANVHRGVHSLSQKATEEYEMAHKKVANFINAKSNEIIFTKSTTESLNLLAYSLSNDLNKGDEIILTEMEHHSNLVPWQQIAKQKQLSLKFIKIKKNGELDLNHAKEIITERTKIVSVTHISNVLGTINDVKQLANIAHNKKALFVIDGAQSVPHLKIDVRDINCDFFAFSAHKMLGPTGVGILYGKEEILKKMKPFLYGGDMISEVRFDDSSWNEIPWKFEAGTPNIADGIAFSAAINYLEKIGMDKIKEYEEYLTDYALQKLSEINNLTIYGPTNNRASVISFNIEGIHPHDVSTILDREGIAIRGGHMCAMPLVTNILNTESVCRISLYFYNTTEEIDKLIDGIKKVKGVFKI